MSVRDGVLAEEFTRSDADGTLEVPREMALVDEADEESGLGDGAAAAKKGLGFQDADLELVLVRR